MKKKLVHSLIGLVGCTWLAGCNQEKPEGAQTIIVELADPSDQQEAVEDVNEEESQDVSESDTEAEETPGSMEIMSEQDNMPRIIGFADQVELSYTQISSDDPIIGLMISNIFQDVQAKDFEITDVQAHRNGTGIVLAGEVTFQLNVEPEATVTLYRLNKDGELVSETLEVTDGTVSYQSTGCGRWLILDTLLEQRTESVSESESAAESLEGKTEAETEEKSSESEDGKKHSTSATEQETTKPNQPTTKETESTKAPETQPQTTAHTHAWVPVTIVVHHDAAYKDVWIQDSAAWDETVVTKEAWDEQVLVSAAWDETVVTKNAWDEPVYEWYSVCNACGHVFQEGEDVNEHMAAGCWSGWHGIQIQTGSIHHDAETTVIHHDAVYQTIHHDAETTVVYHEATGHTEKAVDQVAWDETVITGYTCSGCGATKEK